MKTLLLLRVILTLTLLFTARASWVSPDACRAREEATMSISGKQIIAPVDVSDVQKILGVSSGDVGTLCRSNKINKWCRYKPVQYPSVNATGFLTSGISIGFISDTPENIALAEPGVYEWNYQIPTGGMNSPYRLTDFLGYNSACVPPITIESPGYTLYGDKGGAVKLYLNDDSLMDSNLKLSDIFDFSQYSNSRFCVAIADRNGTENQGVRVYYVSEYKWGEYRNKDTSLPVEIGIQQLSDWGLTVGATYKWRVFLADIDVDDYYNKEINGISRADFEAAVGTAISIEQEAGIDQGEFTYVRSYLDDLTRPTWLYFSIMWEQLNITVNEPGYENVGVDVYSCNPAQARINAYTAYNISTGELRVRVSITGGHYPWGMLKPINNSFVDEINPVETYSGFYYYTNWIKVADVYPDIGNMTYPSDKSKMIDIDFSDLITKAYETSFLGFSDKYTCNCPMFFIRDYYPFSVGLIILYRPGAGGLETTLISAGGEITKSGDNYIIDF